MSQITPFCACVGARQPNYLVTADDVDNLLAIEVQPLDDRKRKVISLPCADLYAMIYFFQHLGILGLGLCIFCVPFEMTKK